MWKAHLDLNDLQDIKRIIHPTARVRLAIFPQHRGGELSLCTSCPKATLLSSSEGYVARISQQRIRRKCVVLNNNSKSSRWRQYTYDLLHMFWSSSYLVTSPSKYTIPSNLPKHLRVSKCCSLGTQCFHDTYTRNPTKPLKNRKPTP